MFDPGVSDVSERKPFEIEAPKSESDYMAMYEREFGDLWDKSVKADERINGRLYPRFINALVNQLVNGYAPVIVIAGKEGKGKSMAALRIAEILHEEINVCAGPWTAANLAYDVIPFIERVRKSMRQAIIFDEAGVNLNSKRWYTDFNRAVDKVVQTQRIRENVYIFVLPKVDDLDNSIRERIDLRLVVEDKGYIKPTMYDYNFGRLESSEKKRKKYYPSGWDFDLPSDELVREYRAKEGEFKYDTLVELEKELMTDEKKRKGEASDIYDLLNE